MEPLALEPWSPTCRVRESAKRASTAPSVPGGDRWVQKQRSNCYSRGASQHHHPSSTVDDLAPSRGRAPNLAGGYSFNRDRPACPGVGWAPDRELMAGFVMASQSRRSMLVECQQSYRHDKKRFLISRSRCLMLRPPSCTDTAPTEQSEQHPRERSES